MAFVTCPNALGLRRLAQSLCPGVVRFLPCDIFIVHVAKRVLAEFLVISFISTRSLYDPVQVLNRRFSRNIIEILSKKLLREDLADAMSWMCLCENYCRKPFASERLHKDLVRSAPAAAGPRMTIL